VNRNARAEKQSAGCKPTSKRFDSSLDFPLHSTAAGGQQLTLLIHQPISELGAANRASGGVIDAIHCR
jgi:hypothetical protein